MKRLRYRRTDSGGGAEPKAVTRIGQVANCGEETRIDELLISRRRGSDPFVPRRGGAEQEEEEGGAVRPDAITISC